MMQDIEKKDDREMGRKTYENIEIPAELENVVKSAIASVDREECKKRAEEKRMSDKKNKTVVRMFKYCACAAAALMAAFTVGVNTSESFAMEAHKLPVIGQLAKVLTVRSWHEAVGDYEYNVEVPEIAEEQESSAFVGAGLESYLNPGFTADVNAQIEKIVDGFIEQAEAEMEAYKESFFENGGTKEEWNERTMDIYADYDVKYQQGNILSLELVTAKTWVNYEEARQYYNLDLENESMLTLEQLLGEDYIEIATESIISQIEERIQDETQCFFGYGDDDDMIEGFTQLSPDAMFYINEKGNVVIVFSEYEIAPGYMGFPEFEIVK